MIKPTINDLERQYEAFEKELSKYLALIEKMGARMVEMQTAILYRRVVGEECDTIKMLLCLRVMKDHMLPGDEIVDEPDDFDGRYLKVRFQLPRKSHKKKK
jgi:hypothetical protein